MKKLFTILLLIIFYKPLVAKEGEMGFGFDIGYGIMDIGAKDTAQTIANLSGSTVTYSYDYGALAGRLYLDYGLTSELSLEAGYFRSGDLEAKYTLSGATVTETYSVNGIDISAVYSPEGQGYFFKTGFHSSEISGNASITISGTTYAAKATAEGSGYLIGGGFDYGDSSRVGYTYYSDIGGESDANIGYLYYGWKF